MNKTLLNAKEVKETLKFMIQNNVRLANEGKRPISLEVEGIAGIGKTSIISQVAKEEDKHFVRLNLSEITLEDLIGYPIKEYKLQKNKEEPIWVIENAVESYINDGYNHVNDSRMSYAIPKWMAGKTDKPVILLLDDYTRGTGSLMQATMTLIDEGGYVSWSLPVGSTVVLSSNPDNGEFMVTSLDDAQKSRFLSVGMKFDVDTWAEWAESYGLDSRCINFILKHPEVVDGASNQISDEKGNKYIKANIRLWTKYFDTIGGIRDFDNSDSFKLLMDLGGCLPKEHMQLFSAFIKQKLDKLPSSEDLLLGKAEKIKNELENLIYPQGRSNPPRVDLQGIICKRMVNFCQYHEEFFNKSKEKDDLINRVGDILFAWNLFNKDFIQLASRRIVRLDTFKRKLMQRPELIKHFS